MGGDQVIVREHVGHGDEIVQAAVFRGLLVGLAKGVIVADPHMEEHGQARIAEELDAGQRAGIGHGQVGKHTVDLQAACAVGDV